MSYALLVDDERSPCFLLRLEGGRQLFVENALEWVVARSFEDAVEAVRVLGFPSFISFDHDLGGGPTGYDLAKRLAEMEMDGDVVIPDDFRYFVHSQNPVGAENIRGFMESWT